MTNQHYDMESAFYLTAIPDIRSNIYTREFLIDTGNQRFHYHDTFEIGLCLGGRGTLYTENGSFPFHEGDIQIIFPFIQHISISAPDDIGHWIFTALRPEQLLLDNGFNIPLELYEIIREKYGFSGLLSSGEHKDIASCVRTIIDESRRNTLHSNEICTLEMMALLYRLKRLEYETTPKIINNSSFQKILPALTYLAHHNNTIKVKVSDLAAMCCISETYFRNLFHEITGFSPQKYIRRNIINAAEYMLKSSNDSIEMISERLGFTDTSGFYRMFVACMGMSPSEYRSNYKKYK